MHSIGHASQAVLGHTLRTSAESASLADALIFVALMHRSEHAQRLVPVRRALVGACAALLHMHVHERASEPGAQRAPEVLGSSASGRLLRIDPLVAWESLALSRALHISLHAGVAASPAFAARSWPSIEGAGEGVQAGSESSGLVASLCPGN